VPRYFLSSDVYWCETNDSVVFLNVPTGKYLAIDKSLLQHLARFVDGWPQGSLSSTDKAESCTPANLDELVAAGLITTKREAGKPASATSARPVEVIPPAGLAELQGVLGVRHRLSFVACAVYVTTMLTLFRLRPLVKRLELARGSAHVHDRQHIDMHHIARLVGAFLRLRPWLYTAKNHCLTDSLTLAIFLRRWGVPATFVMGVATKPFAAHAWVQVTGTVLNDTLENVQAYVPIIAV